ncbi:MAG: hypothetical protein C0614_06000 [Desulfuromonas sp.]|nr:MAG: hypothetical protein C0614_06000 [Desulfuromonas sp.]
MTYDTIIAGAGLSGLTVALLLSRSGRKVLVLERQAQPAPLVRGFSRGGIYFDSGFHYVGGLGPGGAFRSLFRHLGLEDRLELTPLAKEGFDHLRCVATGRTLSLPLGFEEIKHRLTRLFPEATSRIEPYIDEIAGNWSRLPYLDLDLDLERFALQSAHGVSLEERLREFAPWPELQGLLSMHSLLYGVPADSAPVRLNLQVAGSYYHSAHSIRGGGRALVDALLNQLEEVGAEVRCQAEIVAIRAAANKVAGVTLHGGEEIAAREIVSTINPHYLPNLVATDQLRPAYRKRLANLRQTCSAYVVYARSDRMVDMLSASNLFVQPRAGVIHVAEDAPFAERPYFLAASSQGEGKKQGVIGIIPASYDEVGEWSSSGSKRCTAYRLHKEWVGQRLLELFMKQVPELGELELLDLATPLTLSDWTRAPGGAIYGTGHFLGQYNPHPVTRLPGLFLSGQAVAAPGLLGTVIAAYLTCGSMLGHERLRREIRQCL